MRKTLILLNTILFSILIASLFGILNNQITYSISPEFYTKSLFPLFGFVEYGLNTPKTTAAIIGVWSTWWLGLLIGIVIGFTSLIHDTSSIMKKEIKKSLFITIASVIVFGVLGYVFGQIYLQDNLITFGFKGTQEQLKNYHIAGFIHDFEYLGGIIGLLVAVYFQVKSKI
ncbi:hypothetical protein [Flavobacterium sp. SM2513]|uniref:hypothetical protein n=1 Tax=Flavobacterium sp. SM2513 TaxID=3424766 RepID=UPI003D7F8DDE